MGILIGILLLALALPCAVLLCAHKKRSIGNCDCLVVLGAKIKDDDTMSTTLRLRCEAAKRSASEVRALIVCGGNPVADDHTEAWHMRSWLTQNGVDGGKILTEGTSVNTWQNMVNAKAIMAENGLCRAALVTSDYHVTRALWMAHDVGLSVGGAVAAQSKPGFVDRCKCLLRESVSWAKYWFIRLTKKK